MGASYEGLKTHSDIWQFPCRALTVIPSIKDTHRQGGTYVLLFWSDDVSNRIAGSL